MIIQVHSQGGIGNQLFQALAAHELAISFPESRVVFVNSNDPSERKFELSGFFTECKHVCEGSRAYKYTWAKNRLYDWLVARGSLLTRTKLFGCYIPIEVGDQSRDVIIREIKQSKARTVILRGYFQSSTYIRQNDECFNRLLMDFIRLRASKELRPITNLLLMHARRGDYLQNPSLGPLSSEYFEKVLGGIGRGSSTLVVYTDGNKEEFSKFIKEFNSEENRSFSQNPWDLLFDAMSAKIFIGSNSTLSWWASYLRELNSGEDQGLSIFPDEWYVNSPTKNQELYLSNWQLGNAIWKPA